MRYACFALSFCLIASAASADVIPTRVATAEEEADRAAVAQRFRKMGVRSAAERAAALPAEEAAFFASHPRALQWVAGDEKEEPGTDEYLLGALYLVGTIAVVFVPVVVDSVIND